MCLVPVAAKALDETCIVCLHSDQKINKTVAMPDLEMDLFHRPGVLKRLLLWSP